MQRNGHENILDDPSHIYNCDKTGLPMAPKLGKVKQERAKRMYIKLVQVH